MYRWIPQNSTEIAHPDGLGVVYQYQHNGRTCAVAYPRKAGKATWNFAFSNQENLDKKVASFFEGLTQRAKDVIERRAAANQPHPLKVDDIVVNSWGWEQTNVDFYKVTKVSTCYVWLVSIGSKEVPGSGMSHGMACRVVADPTLCMVVTPFGSVQARHVVILGAVAVTSSPVNPSVGARRRG